MEQTYIDVSFFYLATNCGYEFQTLETPDSPCQCKRQTPEANGCHFWTFLGFQGSAADLWLESNPGSESETRGGEILLFSIFK